MEQRKDGSGFFKRIVNKASERPLQDGIAASGPVADESNKKIEAEFEAVKRYPGHLSGWDFDRAFDFIERYPDSSYTDILLGQMYATNGPQLKGLSYKSGVKVLELLPGHTGADSIIRGMYKIEEDLIKLLPEEVIEYVLRTLADHPLGKELSRALVEKNFTHAYRFVTDHPGNGFTRGMIKVMFERDANVAVLLFQEKMDHPQVSAIFEGIYGITAPEAIQDLTPNAILFILDIAPDHPHAREMIDVLVESNYIKAYDFITRFPDHILAEQVKSRLLTQKPELQKLFDGQS